MLATCNGPVPVLFNVMFLELLVVPITWDEKDTDAGLTETAGVVPVPFNARTCVEPRFPESSLTFKAPVTGSDVEGVNVTCTAQFAAGVTIDGQLLVSENAPPVDRLNKFSGLPPKFVMVIVCAALVVPTFWEKVRLGGVKLIAEGSGVGSDTGTAP
jgi:hypothetical protein